MAKLKAIITSLSSGISSRCIAKNIGISDKTVRNYVKKIKADNLSFKELLALDELELENRFCIGHNAVTDERFEYLKEKLEQYFQEWNLRYKTHVTKELLWSEYVNDCIANKKDYYQYSQFVYHFNQYIGPQKIGCNFAGEKEPGKFLEVDFTGEHLSYVNPQTGEMIEIQIFLGTFPCTGALFAMPIPSQKIDDFIYCLDCCVRTMGVPKIMVCDNLKAGVIEYDRYAPKLNEAYEALCAHYGIIPFSTRAFRPKDKPGVERNVQVVYNHIFAPLRKRQFFSYKELSDAVAIELKKYMQSRPARSEYSREELFLSIEKPALLDLNPEPFELVRIKTLRVMSDCFIRFEENKKTTFYSVPYQHIGKVVTVKYTRDKIVISDNKTIIAKHIRQDKPKVYELSHFPSYYENYYNVNVAKYLQRAKSTGSAHLPEVLTKIFDAAKYPEVEYKHADGLLHLQKISNAAIFERSCEIALKLDNLGYRFIRNLIDTRCAGFDYVSNEVVFPSNNHENIRGKGYFQMAFDFIESNGDESY